MKETNNVVLFPGMLQQLEVESFTAMDEENYETALEKLNLLLSHQISSYKIHVGKLICLIKLNQFIEAEQFCEELLWNKDDHHYDDYFDYYTMILYERNKFSELMTAIEEEKKVRLIPDKYLNKLEQLYNICYQMNEMTASELLKDLHVAVEENDHQKQWYIINKWKQLSVKVPPFFITLLQQEVIHPVVKTYILEVVQQHDVNEKIEIIKFGDSLMVNLDELPQIDEHPIYQKTLEQIRPLEQENPTLFQLVNELLDQFVYVRYPFYYPDDDVQTVARALIHLGKVHLSLHSPKEDKDKKINKFIQHIQVCNELYLNIIL